MTPEDKEMFQLCIEAFESIPIAAKSRKMLKKLHAVPVAYSGTGSHILARVMVERIHEWLAR